MSSLEAAAYNEARLARIAAEAGSGPSLKLSVPFFQSGTWTAPQDGVLEMRAMGAGGGGATGGSPTGGYSGAWGVRTIRVTQGEVVSFSVGAGGADKAGAGAGLSGGSTTITVAGVTRTAPGGPGGVYAASGTTVVPDGPALPAGDWEFGASSVKPGTAIGAAPTGGAGVDIFAKGGNYTTSASVSESGGGGTGGPSVGATGGGALPSGEAADGRLTPSTADGFYVVVGPDDWIISFYGGSGGNGASKRGGNGGGGGGGAGGGGGGNGGGGGAQGGRGGIGGGGGASLASGKAGGNGYACLHFYPDTGV